MLAVEAVPVLLHASRAGAQPERDAPARELVEIACLGGKHQRGTPEGICDRAAELDRARCLCHRSQRNRRRAIVKLSRPYRREPRLLREPRSFGKLRGAARARYERDSRHAHGVRHPIDGPKSAYTTGAAPEPAEKGALASATAATTPPI